MLQYMDPHLCTFDQPYLDSAGYKKRERKDMKQGSGMHFRIGMENDAVQNTLYDILKN